MDIEDSNLRDSVQVKALGILYPAFFSITVPRWPLTGSKITAATVAAVKVNPQNAVSGRHGMVKNTLTAVLKNSRVEYFGKQTIRNSIQKAEVIQKK